MFDVALRRRSSIYHSNELTSSCRPLTRKSNASLFTVLNCSINHTLFHSSEGVLFSIFIFSIAFGTSSTLRVWVNRKNIDTPCVLDPNASGVRVSHRGHSDRTFGMAMNRFLKLPKCERNAHPKLTMAFFHTPTILFFTAHAATRKVN